MTIFFTGWIVFIQDFYLRYRRATLGIFWFFMPALIGAAAVLIAAMPLFNQTINPNSFGTLHLLVNVLIFQSFADGITIPIQMLRRTRILTRDTPIQPEAILIASFYMGFFTLLTRLPLFLGAEYLFFKHIGFGWLYLQAFNLGLLLLGLIFGAILAPLSMVMLDVRFGLPFIQGFFLFLTPVVYPVHQSHFLMQIQAWNPLAFFLLNSQSQITGLPGLPISPTIIFMLGISLLLFSYAIYFFNKAVKRIPEIL